jgi:hypothetical protein
MRRNILNSLDTVGTSYRYFLCTIGVIYGCLEIHVDFIKVAYLYLIYLYKGLRREIGVGV